MPWACARACHGICCRVCFGLAVAAAREVLAKAALEVHEAATGSAEKVTAAREVLAGVGWGGADTTQRNPKCLMKCAHGNCRGGGAPPSGRD